jgi:hypothetical protein
MGGEIKSEIMSRKAKSPFQGRWSIDSMSMWDKDYIDVEVLGFIDFGADELGSFQFGYVHGDIDYRTTLRGDEPAVEFTFDGMDGADGTPYSGRGWMTLQGESLVGMLFLHRGDESEIELSRMPEINETY